MQRPPLVILIASLLALTSFGCKKGAPKPQAFQNPNRVVIDESAHGGWVVALPDAADADNELTAFMQAKRPDIAAKLSTYYGQYYGVTDLSGDKIIQANFFCQSYLDNRARLAQMNPAFKVDAWKTQRVEVNDGGPCFFHVSFNPEKRTFEHLFVNGDA